MGQYLKLLIGIPRETYKYEIEHQRLLIFNLKILDNIKAALLQIRTSIKLCLDKILVIDVVSK